MLWSFGSYVNQFNHVPAEISKGKSRVVFGSKDQKHAKRRSGEDIKSETCATRGGELARTVFDDVKRVCSQDRSLARRSLPTPNYPSVCQWMSEPLSPPSLSAMCSYVYLICVCVRERKRERKKKECKCKEKMLGRKWKKELGWGTQYIAAILFKIWNMDIFMQHGHVAKDEGKVGKEMGKERD